MIRIATLMMVLIATIGNGSAWCGPFDILNETFFCDNWNVLDKECAPKMHIESYKHVRGGVNITGFDNMSVIDGVQYVNGHPEDLAIVKYKAWHTDITGSVDDFVHTLTVAETCSMGNNTTTAELYILFTWNKRVAFGPAHFGWKPVEEPLTVHCSVDSPAIFNNSIGDYKITITSYNNSVMPYTLIYLPDRWNIVKETVEYKSNIITYNHKIGWLTSDNNGSEYVKFINTPSQVRDPTGMVLRQAGYYVINDAPLDWNMLNISVFTPYVEIDDVPCHVTVVHSKPSDYVQWKLMLAFLAFVVFCVGIAYGVTRSWRR